MFALYCETLPTFYNDYLNQCLTFCDQTLRERHGSVKPTIKEILLSSTENVYRSEYKNLDQIVKSVRKHQANLEHHHESQFQGCKFQHDRFSTLRTHLERKSFKLTCCQNIHTIEAPKEQTDSKKTEKHEQFTLIEKPVSAPDHLK